jgi:hypothetical protein
MAMIPHKCYGLTSLKVNRDSYKLYREPSGGIKLATVSMELVGCLEHLFVVLVWLCGVLLALLCCLM